MKSLSKSIKVEKKDNVFKLVMFSWSLLVGICLFFNYYLNN